MPSPPYPLHPSVANRLALQYVSFYNRCLKDLQQSHYQPIAVSRLGGKIVAGSSQSLPVGRILDLSIPRKESVGPDGLSIRCFIPEGGPPRTGWPVMLYYHGGGLVREQSPNMDQTGEGGSKSSRRCAESWSRSMRSHFARCQRSDATLLTASRY